MGSTAGGNIIANQGFRIPFGTVQQANGLAINAYYISAWGGISSGLTVLANLTGGL